GLNVGETGVDFLWRESATEGIDDGDTTTILHANVSLLKTSVEYNNEIIVKEYSLSQNYPNPFNPSTVINFSLPENGLVTLKIYNILGEEVAEVINNVKAAGNYKVSFNASNLASGMYIYQIQAGKFSAAKKMMLIK
ncbi:MAG: T9SS type A sorting domain-containing protein, partial [Bacteroidota bacterium]